ncbi:MAG: phosphatidylinositol kinase [Acidobacteria bacterium]|nr:MAG: phosphatidylinositol kinase [Acidobacteriota bacterium]PYY24543.1 MAG: phosphatidylinositol kinase [Acidobacteriota bacterium]
MSRYHPPPVIQVKQHLRPMRGGAQSHLMFADDGHYYVVKFQNNPQHIRVLANELIATRIAERVGLPVPIMEVVEVSSWLIENTPDLRIRIGSSSIPCQHGLALGGRFVLGPLEGQVFDYLPASALDRVRNLDAFAGMLALDKWTCNSNGRQAVFWKKTRDKKYTATFVDQGYCFNAGEWSYPDSPLRGVYPRNEVYADVRGWESFEPWLSRIENIDPAILWEIAESVPPEWYGSAVDDLEHLIEGLIKRRTMVRDLIDMFRTSSREPFQNWEARTSQMASHSPAGS